MKNKLFYFMIFVVALIFISDFPLNNAGNTLINSTDSMYKNVNVVENASFEEQLESGIIQSHVVKNSGAVTIKFMDFGNNKTIEADKVVDFRDGDVSRDVSYSIIHTKSTDGISIKKVIVLHNKILGNGDRDKAMTRDHEILKNI